ncbi:MAG: replication initiator protein [Microviridae sp.]|nr:MAG: replication initiator protein [Microviridae sp.]
MDVESIQRLFAEAMSSETFDRHGTRLGTWDISGTCDKPVPITHYSRASGLAKSLSKGAKMPPGIGITLLTPCRQCEACLKFIAYHWRMRAQTELQAAQRTWMVTFTCRPDFHVWIDHVCATRKGNFWAQPPDKIFAARTKVFGEEITKYLKRLRKQSGAKIRYLLIAETHDGLATSDFLRGRPHFHMLLHETETKLSKSFIQGQWHHGHTGCKLADSGASWYVSKYITKAKQARVRASLRYGLIKHEVIKSIYDL